MKLPLSSVLISAVLGCGIVNAVREDPVLIETRAMGACAFYPLADESVGTEAIESGLEAQQECLAALSPRDRTLRLYRSPRGELLEERDLTDHGPLSARVRDCENDWCEIRLPGSQVMWVDESEVDIMRFQSDPYTH